MKVDAGLRGWQFQGWFEGQSGEALGFGNVIVRGNLRNLVLPVNQRTTGMWFNNTAANTVFERDPAKQHASNLRTLPLRVRNRARITCPFQVSGNRRKQADKHTLYDKADKLFLNKPLATFAPMVRTTSISRCSRIIRNRLAGRAVVAGTRRLLSRRTD
jgi:hypothetical protein